MTYQAQYLAFFMHKEGEKEREALYLQGIKKEAYGLRNITFSKS